MFSGRYYPRSFTILVIVAMGVLIVPLASGLINVVHVLQGVVETQRQFTRNSLAITRDVRLVVESVSQFQRAAGQYHLLQDSEFGPALKTRYDELQTELSRLDTSLQDAASKTTLATLQQRSVALFKLLRPSDHFIESTDFHALEPEFNTLHQNAQTLLSQADSSVQGELQDLEATMQATRHRLIMLALALIPLTLLLATVFSWMINRPIKQLKTSIQQIGRASLQPLPAINGPQDIIELGREIDLLRQRLQALEEQKLRFLRHVSHELKTPLASLREGVALLGDELAGSLNDRQRSIVKIMDNSSRDLQQRIEDLIRQGNLVPNTAHSAATQETLVSVLDTLLARHRLTLEAHKIQVASQFEAPVLHANRSQLETILDNLLSNAIKFSPEGGHILLRSEPAGNAIALLVCDQGCGIPVAERARIFEPFFQGTRQPASPVRGSGIGLSIVRESLLTLGGRIDVIDRSPWSTCFQITWPAPQ